MREKLCQNHQMHTMPNSKAVILRENIPWILDRYVARQIFADVRYHFPSCTKYLSAVYTKQSSKHNNTKHLSARFHARLKTSQRCV